MLRASAAQRAKDECGSVAIEQQRLQFALSTPSKVLDHEFDLAARHCPVGDRFAARKIKIIVRVSFGIELAWRWRWYWRDDDALGRGATGEADRARVRSRTCEEQGKSAARHWHAGLPARRWCRADVRAKSRKRCVAPDCERRADLE
jgi:hypothetical protein